jgi:outer membrane lipoprotein-sorting protein
MKKYRFITIVFSLIMFFSGSLFSQDALTITKQMFATVKTIKTVQYSFDSKERVKDKVIHEVSDFKMNIQPFNVYMYQQAPKKGIEVLFIAESNNNKAKINSASFPWVTLNLDPEGSLMLDKHHHSLYDGGFSYTTSLIEFLLKKYEEQSAKLIVNNGDVKIQGVDCYHFTFSNPNYRLVNYTVGENETPMTLARKLKLNYFSILENNPNIKGLGKINPGTKLVLPNDYAAKMELYIHKDKLYPVYLKIYDHKGLYEEYTFTNVIINPVFKSDVFSADNPSYKF